MLSFFPTPKTSRYNKNKHNNNTENPALEEPRLSSYGPFLTHFHHLYFSRGKNQNAMEANHDRVICTTKKQSIHFLTACIGIDVPNIEM